MRNYVPSSKQQLNYFKGKPCSLFPHTTGPSAPPRILWEVEHAQKEYVDQARITGWNKDQSHEGDVSSEGEG